MTENTDATETTEERPRILWPLRILYVVIFGLLVLTAFLLGQNVAFNDNSAPSLSVNSVQNEDGGWDVSFITFDLEDLDEMLSLDTEIDVQSGTATHVETRISAIGSRYDVYEVSSGAFLVFEIRDTDGGYAWVMLVFSEDSVFSSSFSSK